MGRHLPDDFAFGFKRRKLTGLISRGQAVYFSRRECFRSGKPQFQQLPRHRRHPVGELCAVGLPAVGRRDGKSAGQFAPERIGEGDDGLLGPPVRETVAFGADQPLGAAESALGLINMSDSFSGQAGTPVGEGFRRAFEESFAGGRIAVAVVHRGELQLL